MNSPLDRIKARQPKCIAVCKIQSIEQEVKVANQLESLEFEYGLQKLAQGDLEMQFLAAMDVEQIPLSSTEMRSIEKLCITNNYALALTTKKEPMFWGTLEGTKSAEEKQQATSLVDSFAGTAEQKLASNTFKIPQKIPFFKSIKISDICCNDFACHFLSEDGMLYTMGKDVKKYGILGLGSQYELLQPCPNNSLIDFRIKQIAMGLSHCVALTSSGSLYSWGTGQNGQLCLQQDETMYTNTPKCMQGSKNKNITQIYCSSYYTLLVTNDQTIEVYGSLKGFSKFLFDSPTKDAQDEKDKQAVNTLSFEGDSVGKIALTEKAFAVYMQESHKLFFVNDTLKRQMILERKLKGIQFLNNGKYVVAQDSSKFTHSLIPSVDNVLVILSQKSGKTESEWSVIKEINLIKEFNTNHIELLPQDTSVVSKKMQSMQLLAFSTQNKPLNQLVNKKEFKTFLSNLDYSQLNNCNQDPNMSRNGLSPYTSYQERPSRKKLQIKLDTLFGTNRKDQERSQSIKERAKKLHQSLSPVQRFPLINNLCEFIKKQQIIQVKKSPEKVEDMQKSQQFNMLLNSFNFAYQLNTLGEPMSGKSGKQMQFLQKAEKIKEELRQRQIIQQPSKCCSSTQINDMMELASPDLSRQQQNVSELTIVNKVDTLTLPLQMPTVIQTVKPVVTQKLLVNAKNLSCIMEDKEQNSTCINNPSEVMPLSSRGVQAREGLMRVPYHQKNRMSEIVIQHMNPKEGLLEETFSEISGRDSNYRFSMGSCLTNTNSYRILLMNVRNVIEKKMLYNIMTGFSAIKYHQHEQQTQIQDSCLSVNEENAVKIQLYQTECSRLVGTLQRLHLTKKAGILKQLQTFGIQQKEQQRAIKKIINLVSAKQDQTIIDSLSKIQMVSKFAKLQRLNFNILFNTLHKITKKHNRLLLQTSLAEIHNKSEQKKKQQTLYKLITKVSHKLLKKGLIKFQANAQLRKLQNQGLLNLLQVLKQISYRHDINKQYQGLRGFKDNVLRFKEDRIKNLHSQLLKIATLRSFNKWRAVLQKRKVAIQQAVFLKMTLSDMIKRLLYYSFVRIGRCSIVSPASKKNVSVEIQMGETNQTKNDTEQTSKIIQEDNKQEINELDIEESQIEGDYGQRFDLPRQLTGFCQEFSFDDIDDKPHQLTTENNITAQFSSNNMAFSKKKDTVNKKLDMQEFKESTRPHYHCHFANKDQDAPEALILDPIQSSNAKTLDDSTDTQRMPLKMLIQNEISPSHNYKNFQRQNNLCKTYEQSDPFEMPAEDIENFNVPSFNLPMQMMKDKLNQEVSDLPRYSFKKVLPFNPPEDTPSDTQLRRKKERTDKENKTEVFQQKKQSVPVATQDQKFINNYFNKLQSQAQSKQQSQNTSHNSSAIQKEVSTQQPQTQKQMSRCTSKQGPNMTHQNQTSFVTNNGIDIMQFNSHSDQTSFMFFDDGAQFRESGISSFSRSSMSRSIFGGGLGIGISNQSFGLQNPLNNLNKGSILSQRGQSKKTHNLK